MDITAQNDPASDEQNDPAVDEPNDLAVTDKDTILPSDDSKKEPMDDDGVLPVGAVNQHVEPDEEPANAADKESPGEEKDHPQSPHVHEVEGHDDVENENANDRALLERPGGDDDADVDSDVDQEAMQCDDAESHHSESDEVLGSVGEPSQSKSVRRRAARRWMLSSKAPTSPKRRSQRLADKFTPIKSEQSSRRGSASKVVASKGPVSVSKPSTAVGRRARQVKSAVVPAAKAVSGHGKHGHDDDMHAGDRRSVPCTARTSAGLDGVRPIKAKPKPLAPDFSHDAHGVKTCTAPNICKKSKGSVGSPAPPPLVLEMKHNLQMAAEKKDYTLCVKIEEEISALELSFATEFNKAVSHGVCGETKDPEEAVNMRMAVVQSLLDQASQSKRWQECVSHQQELADLALHLNTIRREVSGSGKRNELQRTLADAQLNKDWLECARISEELKNLPDDMCFSECDAFQTTTGLGDDSIARRIASLEQELNAAAESKLFVQCQALQQEIESLRNVRECPIVQACVPGDHVMSEPAASIQQKLLDLENSQLRASAANDYEECDRIESEIADLKRLSESNSDASVLEDTRQKISSLEIQQAAAVKAKDWKKCMAIRSELSQLSSTLQPTSSQLDSSSTLDIQPKIAVLQQTLIQLETLQEQASVAKDFMECVRVGQQIKETKDSISALWNSNVPGKDAAKSPGFAQGVEAKGGVQMSIQELLESSVRLPPRVSVSGVRIGAVGKVTSDAGTGGNLGPGGVKGGGKGKGKFGDKSGKGSGKADSSGVSKGKGKGSMNKVVLHVFDEASGHTITLHWKKATLSVAGLEKALANISNATPVISDNGQVHLELDHRSDVKALLNPRDCTLDLYRPIASNLTLTISQSYGELIGSYYDIVLRCQRVTLKAKSDGSGDQFLQVQWVDVENQMMQMPVFDYNEIDFQEGHYYIAWGLALKAGRSRLGGGLWGDDYTWGQLRYSGWSTAFVNVVNLTDCILVVD